MQELSSGQSSMVCARRPYLRVCLTDLNLLVLGILVVLFFQCMTLLLNPVNPRRGGIKWGVVFYTATMFSFATVLTGMGIQIGSISFIDNREFPGVEGLLPPGPLGYQDLIRPTAITIIPNLMFFLNNWLADCLLVSSSFDHVPAAPRV